MTDRPIIMSGPMVKAWLAGNKTMTRRLAWIEEKPKVIHGRQMTGAKRSSPWQSVELGDRLWVRENIKQAQARNILTGEPLKLVEAVYAADDESVLNEHGFNLLPWWKGNGMLPSIHMPRSRSRLTLVVTATRIERLQAISASDCYDESVERPSGPMLGSEVTKRDNARNAFRRIWTTIHGPDAWSQNPEVVAISATAHRCNIDAMPK